jgi:hypothetical protein
LTKLCHQSAIALVLSMTLSLNLCAASAIGTVNARGTFNIDHARVEQATVFEGSSIATGQAVSEIALGAGTRLLLGPGSEGTIYGDRFVLAKGEARMDAPSRYLVEAAGLRIESSQSPASLRLARNGDTLQLLPLRGTFTIRDLQGRMLATTHAGDNLQITPPSSQTSNVRLTGKVRQVDGKYLLTDEASKSTFELRGESVKAMAGKRITVSGSTSGGQVVEVASVHAAAAAGLSTTAVVAGVVIASGAGVALGVGLTQDEAKPTASR